MLGRGVPWSLLDIKGLYKPRDYPGQVKTKQGNVRLMYTFNIKWTP